MQNYPSWVFIWLVPLASFSSTELIHWNFVGSMLRINIYKVWANPQTFWEFIHSCIFYIMNVHVSLAS